jgi:hypothetical protein
MYKRFWCRPLFAAALEWVSRVKFSHDRVTVKGFSIADLRFSIDEMSSIANRKSKIANF